MIPDAKTRLHAWCWLLVAVAAPDLMFGAGSGTQRLETRPGSPVTIDYLQFYDNTPPCGWLPVGFRIRNDSASDLSWLVNIHSTTFGGTTLLGEWDLSVPAGDVREFNLLVPQPWLDTPGGFGALRGTITGPGVVNSEFAVGNSNYLPPNRTAYTGMSQTLAPENWGQLEAELNPGRTGTSPRSGGTVLAGARFEPATIPADWRSYSGFQTIWLHRSDWIALSGVQRLALLRWVFQGGRLYVVGDGSGLEDLPDVPDVRRVAHQLWQSGPWGFGTVTRLTVPAEQFQQDGAPTNQSMELPIADVAAAIRDRTEHAAALAGLTHDNTPTAIETAVGEIRPGGILLGLLVGAIALLLGPVNVFVLAPAQRRARLFITVPIIAVAGAVALLLLILVQDGTGGRGRRGVLIALMPDRPEALLVQEQASLTGLLLRRGFEVPEEILVADYSRDSGAGARFGRAGQRSARPGLDRRGPTLSGSWFSSRSVQSHHLRGFVPTRASLTLERTANDGYTALSTCPATLRDVVIFDATGQMWAAAEIPPGRKVTLESAPSLSQQWRSEMREYGFGLAGAAAQGDGALVFRAKADRWDESAPIRTVASIRWRDDAIFVTGPVREARP